MAQAKALGLTMTGASAEAAHDYEIKLDLLHLTMRKLRMTAASELIPVIGNLVDRLSALGEKGILAQVGMRVGNAIAGGLQSIVNWVDSGALDAVGKKAWASFSWIEGLFSEGNTKAAGDWFRYLGEMGSWSAKAIAAEWPNATGYLREGFDYLIYGAGQLYRLLPDIIEGTAKFAMVMMQLGGASLYAMASTLSMMGLVGPAWEAMKMGYNTLSAAEKVGPGGKAAADRIRGNMNAELLRGDALGYNPWWNAAQPTPFTPTAVNLVGMPTAPTSAFSWPNPNAAAANPFAMSAPSQAATGMAGYSVQTSQGTYYKTQDEMALEIQRQQLDEMRRIRQNTNPWTGRPAPAF